VKKLTRLYNCACCFLGSYRCKAFIYTIGAGDRVKRMGKGCRSVGDSCFKEQRDRDQISMSVLAGPMSLHDVKSCFRCRPLQSNDVCCFLSTLYPARLYKIPASALHPLRPYSPLDQVAKGFGTAMNRGRINYYTRQHLYFNGCHNERKAAD